LVVDEVEVRYFAAMEKRILVFAMASSPFSYQVFACYGLLNDDNQRLSDYGVWTGGT